MRKDNDLHLEDMFVAICKINSYLESFSYEDFVHNEMAQDAVIRQFEIIGEAASRLSTDFVAENPDFPARQTKEMRNLLVHEYDYVNTKEIWDTVQKDLPDLNRRLKKLLYGKQ